MKRLQPAILSLLLTLTCSVTLANDSVNRIIAVVDQSVILQNQLDEKIKQMYQRMSPEQRAALSANDIKKRVLDKIIITELQLQIARRSGINITTTEVDAAIERIASSNKLSIDKFVAVLAKDDISLPAFKQSVREQILVRRIQSSFVHHEVKVSEQEVNSFLKLLEQNNADQSSEYHLGHILIATPENATSQQIQQAEQKADQLLKQLRAGKKFSTVSISQSDASNALEGGDLGWMKLTQMPSLLKPYVEKMQQGDISPSIQSPSGFHIIQLFSVRGPKKVIVTKTHVRHILIKINALVSDQAAEKRLLGLKQRIADGDDFATLARANSEDRGSAITGGDLNWVQPGALVPAFEEAMNKLAINEVSEPIQSQFGWHLIQVLGREQQDNTQLMRKAQARSQLQKRKADAAIEAWLTKLRDEAYIEYRLND